MAFLRNIMGLVLKYIYEFVKSIFTVEPASFSYLAISIIIISIVFKIVLFPIFLSSIKNQKNNCTVRRWTKKDKRKI